MARIRSIKPEFWESSTLGKCARDARLLFLGLISHADDEGRQRGGARLVLGKVFPYDEDLSANDIEGLIGELVGAGLITLYEVDEQRYIEINSWSEHQRIEKPKRSTFPGPDGQFSDESRREGDKEGDKDKEGNKEKDNLSIVFSYWREKCKHLNAKLSSDRSAKILARLREGRPVEELKQAIDGAAVGAYTNDQGHRFDDIELICRSGAKLDSFVARAQPRKSGGNEWIDRLNGDPED